MKKLKHVWYWHSACEVFGVDFVRWSRMKMHTGGEDTDKLGVGVIVKSNWLYHYCLSPKIDHGLKRGQARLRPYTDLYRSYKDARAHKGKIKRPELRYVHKN